MRELKDVVSEYCKALAAERLAWEAQHAADAAWKAAMKASQTLRETMNTLVGKTPTLVPVEGGVTAIVRQGDYHKEARVEFFDNEGKYLNV